MEMTVRKSEITDISGNFLVVISFLHVEIIEEISDLQINLHLRFTTRT